MAVSRPRDRRPALWPYLVMPLVVLLVFYALRTLHAQQAPGASASVERTAGGVPAQR